MTPLNIHVSRNCSPDVELPIILFSQTQWKWLQFSQPPPQVFDKLVKYFVYKTLQLKFPCDLLNISICLRCCLRFVLLRRNFSIRCLCISLLEHRDTFCVSSWIHVLMNGEFNVLRIHLCMKSVLKSSRSSRPSNSPEIPRMSWRKKRN